MAEAKANSERERLQRQAQDTIYQEGQHRLMPLGKGAERKQRANFLGRKRTSISKNFIVLDTETSGFRGGGGKNEPIQVTAVIYKKGKETMPHFNEVYQVKGRITWSAQ